MARQTGNNNLTQANTQLNTRTGRPCSPLERKS